MLTFPGHLTPTKDDGTKPDASGHGFVLSANETYYVDLAGSEDGLGSAHIKWDDEAILAITVESSNFDEVEITDDTPGHWIPEEDPDAIVPVVGGSADGLGVSVAGGEEGGAMYHLGNNGAQRLRLKVDVGETGGVVRFQRHGKGQ